MDSRDIGTNNDEKVQTGINLHFLQFSFLFVLLLYPSVVFAATESNYSIFDYIIAFIIWDILLSIVWYFVKK